MTPCGLPGKKPWLLPAGILFVFLFSALAPAHIHAAEEAVLRVYDRQSGILYAETPARVNSRLFFGWIHSLEKIPWNEYYHVDEGYNLVLDSITFPAFGAGIPEDKGRVCYVRDGLIHMEEIGQTFTELVWLNSRTATRDILLDGRLVTRGSDLPHHARIRLRIEKGEANGTP
ncbi:MAG: DUF1850 domain-containing protein [Desulfovibrio sp.]|jgi:hypothetical protein|nr:DUF1850 domain-containing protein [Desulfovibrio sp.]